jgi:hypothetical protein
MKPMLIVRLTQMHRRIVVWTSLLLAASGIAWMAAHYSVEFAPDLDGSDVRSWLHLLLKAHGVLGYVGAIVAGSLLGRHVPAALSRRPWRMSGIVLLFLFGGLVATGLMLYYVGDEEIRNTASLLHQMFGLIAAAVAASHIGRRRRAAANSEPSS